MTMMRIDHTEAITHSTFTFTSPLDSNELPRDYWLTEKTFKIGPTNKPTKRSSSLKGTEILATRDTQVRESNSTEFPPRGPFQIASFGTERPGGVQKVKSKNRDHICSPLLLTCACQHPDQNLPRRRGPRTRQADEGHITPTPLSSQSTASCTP